MESEAILRSRGPWSAPVRRLTEPSKGMPKRTMRASGYGARHAMKRGSAAFISLLKSWQDVEKGPAARRRPAVRVERRPRADARRGLSRPAGDAYSCPLNPQPRAPQHAFSQMTHMRPI